VDAIRQVLLESLEESGGFGPGGAGDEAGESDLGGAVEATKRKSLPSAVRTSVRSMWK
jgi:hypothetical protein